MLNIGWVELIVFLVFWTAPTLLGIWILLRVNELARGQRELAAALARVESQSRTGRAPGAT